MIRTAVVVILAIGLLACQYAVAQLAAREVEAVRLVDGTNEREGRVEVMSRGVWGTVCDDLFDNLAARVVCRFLGFQNRRAASVPSEFFGAGTGEILVDDVMCEGNETTLNQCNIDLVSNNCHHNEDVGIVCDGWSITGMRLVNGNTPLEGRLEVQLAGRWGTVCDDGFRIKEARVICRQLGFPSGNPQAVSNAGFGEGVGPIMMDDVICVGDEDNLEQCEVDFTNDCDHDEDVGVICA